MNNNLTVTQSIELNAGKQQVWEALTNPSKIKLYLYGTNTTSDWKINSPIFFEGEFQGHAYKNKGTIVNIKQNELIQYSYWSGFSGLKDKPENYSMVTYRLQETGVKTTLTLTQIGFPNEQAQEHSETGWKQVLDQLKLVVESGA